MAMNMCEQQEAIVEMPERVAFFLVALHKLLIWGLPPWCLSSDMKRTGDQPGLDALRYLSGYCT